LRLPIVDGLTDISTLITVRGIAATVAAAATVAVGVTIPGVITAVPAPAEGVPGAVPHAAKMLAMVTATRALKSNNRVCLCIKFSHLLSYRDGTPP
jgi:hypothetical protein